MTLQKFSTLLIILFFFIYSLTAQNYQTVNSGRTTLFENINHNVKAVRIDSIHFETDSILFPFANMQLVGDVCYTPLGASWIGAKIQIQNNGYNLFFNQLGDTIKIKTNANLNDEWVAYEIFGSMIIKAQIIEVDTMNFLGLNDSVKVVSFQVYNQDMVPINHTLNTFQIILSKNYGLVKTLNFYNFPDYTSSLLCGDDYLNEYEICGINNPEVGLQNIKWFDVFDFQPGDILHIRTYEEIPDCLSQLTCQYENLFIFNYLERTDYPDSICYMVDVQRNYIYTAQTGSGSEYSHYNFNQVIRLNSNFDKLPGEVIQDNSNLFSYQIYNGQFAIKIDQSLYQFFTLNYDDINCCFPTMSDGCFSPDLYFKGLGGPYSNNSDIWCPESLRELVYYNRGGQTWGTPLVINDIDSKFADNPVEVFPNPTIDNINIKSSVSELPLLFELYDITGKLVIRKLINNENFNLSLEEFESGIYVYKLISSHGLNKTNKLVIK